MNTLHSKEDIIAAGEYLFRSRGYHHTGISEILKEAGISKGSFYNYFESKEHFALQVIEYYSDEMLVWIESKLTDVSMTPMVRLRAFCDAMMAANQAEGCQNGCLVYNFSFELAGHSKNFAQALQAQLDRWLPLFEACIAEGQQAGEITKAHSAEALAFVLHTAFNGAAGRMKINRSIAPLREMIDTVLALIEA